MTSNLNPRPINLSASVLRSRLAEIGRQPVNILCDSNCFFHSISHQLYGTDALHAQIRAIAIQYLVKIKEHMKLRDMNLRKTRKTKCRKSKVEINKMLIDAERMFVENEIAQNKDNSRAIWKTIRKYVPKKTGRNLKLTLNSKVAANEFNSYFASVGSLTAEATKKLAQDHCIPVVEYQPVESYPKSEQFSLSQITREELVSTVMNMPLNKSPGNDKVTLNVLKDCLHIVSESLTDLINLSFTSNIFPIAWKTAEVIPLEKEGDCEIASNNRPISLLVANSKLCERVVHDQLTSYLERYGRLTRHQSGNKHKHSTESVHL